MGGTLVARVDGIGGDIFELLMERLHRNRQAFLTENRWSVNIRSYRQPTPPLVEQSFQGMFTGGSYSHERQESGDNVNESGNRSRQRIMYTVRNSAGPDGLVTMVEDVNAPTRSSWRTRLKEREVEMKKRKAKRLIPSDGSLNVQPPDNNAAVISHTEDLNLMSVVKDPSGQTNSVSAENSNVNISTEIDSTITPAHEALEDNDSFLDLPPEPPRHFRISLACFPESFEHLLSNTLISAQGPPGPALWVPRSHTTLINGVIWGLYSTHINLSIVKHDEDSPSFASQTKPDYWIRIGKLTTKGTSISSTSLPWMILEIECVAAPDGLATDSSCAQNVLNQLMQSQNTSLTFKPFFPTAEELFDTGLYLEHNPETTRPDCDITFEARRSGYSMMMLAKREGVI